MLSSGISKINSTGSFMKEPVLAFTLAMEHTPFSEVIKNVLFFELGTVATRQVSSYFKLLLRIKEQFSFFQKPRAEMHWAFLKSLVTITPRSFIFVAS